MVSSYEVDDPIGAGDVSLDDPSYGAPPGHHRVVLLQLLQLQPGAPSHFQSAHGHQLAEI